MKGNNQEPVNVVSFSAALIGAILQFSESQGPYKKLTPEEWAVLMRAFIGKQKMEYKSS